eukprot:13991422-Alexandrium_andersonii.AAC.1
MEELQWFALRAIAEVAIWSAGRLGWQAVPAACTHATERTPRGTAAEGPRQVPAAARAWEPWRPVGVAPKA